MTENNQTDPAARTERVFENNKRIEFTEQFATSSSEYTLVHVWGTTYSVSLSALLMVLFAMEGGGKVPDLSEGKTVNRAQQLEIMRRNLPKLTVLFQQGMIHQDAKLPSEVLEMLMTALQPQIRKEGSFHPKVWLWAFKHNGEEDNYVFRLLVTSRNLTQDTDFDAAVVFDSRKEKPPAGHHQKLFDLFGSSLSEDWKNRLNDVTFSQGLYEGIKDESCIHTVISPFLDVEKIKELTGLNYLFSTREALDHLAGDLPSRIQCFILRDLNELNREIENAENPQDVIESSGEVSHFNLHAKLYFTNTYLLLGSRNCTSRGWYHNVEFMVRLKGQKSATLLNSLVYDPDSEVPQIRSSRNRTQALFEPYTPQFREMEKSDAEDKRSALIELLRTVECQVYYGDDTIRLTLPILPENKLLELEVVPFAFQDNEKVWLPWQKGELNWRIAENQRSPFFCIRRKDLSGFTAILVAKEEDTKIKLEDYVDRVKATFTNDERMEYLCSLDEVPLDDIELVSESDGKNPNSGISWSGRDHRYLERLVQNIVAHPESATKICNELVKMKEDCEYPGLDELITFFGELRQRSARHE